MERKTALPVKTADGRIKKVMRDTALPDPDTVEEEPALSKRARKRARGELIAEKKARERGEVYVKPGATPAEIAAKLQEEEGYEAMRKSCQRACEMTDTSWSK